MNNIIIECEKGGPCKYIRNEITELINSGYTVERIEVVKRYKGMICEANIYYNGGIIYYGY